MYGSSTFSPSERSRCRDSSYPDSVGHPLTPLVRFSVDPMKGMDWISSKQSKTTQLQSTVVIVHLLKFFIIKTYFTSTNTEIKSSFGPPGH